MSDYLSRSPVDVATEDADDQIDNHFPSPTVTRTSIVGAVTTRSHTRQPLPSNHNPIVSPSADHFNPLTTSPVEPSSPLMNDDLRIDYTGDLHELKAAQQLDDHLQHIVRNLSDHRYKEAYFVCDGVLMHRSNNMKPVPCVPKGRLRTDIMRIYHDTPANGAHFGRDKTIRKIRDRYYWDSMNRDISNYVRSCFLCSQNNPMRRKTPGHLKPIAPPAGVWELLAMDFHGPITPTSQRGNKYIISLTDVLSKFVIAKAVRDCTADTAARFIQEEVICKYGTPKCILTDNGTHFTSKIMESLFHRLGVTHLYATPYHPQTNGQIERFNSTMDAKIATLANARRTDWDIQLPYVIFNYNATVHSTTRIIPFELMYGRSAVFPCDSQDPVVSLSQDPHHAKHLTRYISDLTKAAQTNISHLQRQYKNRYDSHRSNPTYKVGDLVLVRTFSPRHKFSIRHEGPFKIVQRLSTKTYMVQHIKTVSLVRQVTVDSIIPLIERNV
jgi:transposase InsO family protein